MQNDMSLWLCVYAVIAKFNRTIINQSTCLMYSNREYMIMYSNREYMVNVQ